MGNVTVGTRYPVNPGAEAQVNTRIAFGASYNNTGSNLTTGETLTAAKLGLSQISRLIMPSTQEGYSFQVLYSLSGAETVNPPAVRIKVYTDGEGTEATQTTSTKVTKLYTGTVTGTVKTPYASITLSQAVSGATATVAAYDSTGGSFTITPTGTFNAANVVTGTNADLTTFTFTPTMTAVNAWTLSPAVSSIVSAETNTSQLLSQVPYPGLLGANEFRQYSTTLIETLLSGGWSSIVAAYVSGGTATEVLNGTNLSVSLASVPVLAFGY